MENLVKKTDEKNLTTKREISTFMNFFHLSNVRSFDTSLFILCKKILFSITKTKISVPILKYFKYSILSFYDQIYDNCFNCSNILIYRQKTSRERPEKFLFLCSEMWKERHIGRVYSTIFVLLIIAQCVLLNTYLGPLLDKQLKIFALASLTVCEC